MMKKKVFMPLLVASMMMGIVVIHSCTKNQDEAIKDISLKALYENMDVDVPIVENGIRDVDDTAQWICPYCHIPLYHLDSHWHYFGTPMANFNYSEMMSWDTTPEGQPRFWAVDACLDGLTDDACFYSGTLQNSEYMIQLLMSELHVSRPVAESMLVPRFHAHKVKYRAFSSNGGNGGQNNTWHVGGGVPGWPAPEVEQP